MCSTHRPGPRSMHTWRLPLQGGGGGLGGEGGEGLGGMGGRGGGGDAQVRLPWAPSWHLTFSAAAGRGPATAVTADTKARPSMDGPGLSHCQAQAAILTPSTDACMYAKQARAQAQAQAQCNARPWAASHRVGQPLQLPPHSPKPDCQLLLGISLTAFCLGPWFSMNRRQALSEALKLHSLHFGDLAVALGCRGSARVAH